MRPDLIIPWPANADYPLWRRWLRANRQRLNRVLIVFTPRASHWDYRGYVSWAMRDLRVTWIEPGPGEWRDAATNAALEHSQSNWVWFTEQDFLIHGDGFWNEVKVGEKLLDEAFGHREYSQDRWHPSCLLVKRDLVESTSCYFGPDPVDHFWTFSRDLDEVGHVVDFEHGLGLKRGVDFSHMAGLSFNHQLVDEGIEVTYKPDEFRAYLRWCLDCGETLAPSWREQIESYLG